MTKGSQMIWGSRGETALDSGRFTRVGVLALICMIAPAMKSHGQGFSNSSVDSAALLGGVRSGPQDELASSLHQFFDAWSRGLGLSDADEAKDRPPSIAESAALNRVKRTTPSDGPRPRMPPHSGGVLGSLAAPSAIRDTRTSWSEPLAPGDRALSLTGLNDGFARSTPSSRRLDLRARVIRRWTQLVSEEAPGVIR